MPIDLSKDEASELARIEAERKQQQEQFQREHPQRSSSTADALWGTMFGRECMILAGSLDRNTYNKIPEDAQYLILMDSSAISRLHAKLAGAINTLAQRGWRCVNITKENQDMYALMERILAS